MTRPAFTGSSISQAEVDALIERAKKAEAERDAIRAETIEECAKVAGNVCMIDARGFPVSAENVRRSIMKAIRSLSRGREDESSRAPQPPKEGE